MYASTELNIWHSYLANQQEGCQCLLLVQLSLMLSGINSGSSILLISLTWAGCLLRGRCDLKKNVSSQPLDSITSPSHCDRLASIECCSKQSAVRPTAAHFGLSMGARPFALGMMLNNASFLSSAVRSEGWSLELQAHPGIEDSLELVSLPVPYLYC